MTATVSIMRSTWFEGFWARHRLLTVIIGVYLAGVLLLGASYDLNVSGGNAAYLATSLLIKIPQMIFFVLLWRAIQLTYVQRVPDRSLALKSEVRGFLTDFDRMTTGLVTSVIMILMLVAFAQAKTLIPYIHPFSWDVTFMEWDRWLHFGHHPYELAHSLFGSDFAISQFTGLYNIWLFLMYFMLFGCCFMRSDDPSRMQFLFAFVFTWAIGGNLLATLFSSAGPVYFASLGLGDAYLPLTDRLQAHAATGALSVVETQGLLWQMFDGPNSVNAISAFPSMHVASSVLMALMGFRIARWVGIALSIFAGLIFIGSFLLAWHYAVDGYAGAVITIIIWKVSGWFVRTHLGPFRKAA